MGVKRVRPVENIVRPFQEFADRTSSGGILLIGAAIVALVWANSPWGESYAQLWELVSFEHPQFGSPNVLCHA